MDASPYYLGTREEYFASLDERDVFGDQQQSAVEKQHIPVLNDPLSKNSSF
jgi:hypothetical protein